MYESKIVLISDTISLVVSGLKIIKIPTKDLVMNNALKFNIS